MLFLSPNGVCSNNPGRNRRRALRAGLVATLGFGAFQAHVLWAQEVPESARQVVLDVSERLEWSDNPDLLVDGESRLTSRTGLSARLERRTRIDRLTLSFGGDYLVTDDDEENGLDSPRVGLSWERDVGRSRIGLAFDANEVDLDETTDIIADEDLGTVDFVILEGGKRRIANVVLDGAFGVEAPFGGSYRLSQSQIRYIDTTDPSLQDADRLRFDGELDFAIDPRITLGIATRFSDFDEEGPGDLDTTSTRVASFADLEITPRLSGRIDLGWQSVEQRGALDTLEEGVVFDAELTQDRPRSTLTYAAASELAATGRRDTLRFDHAIELLRGDLRYSLGVSRSADLSAQPLFGLGWTQELPRAEILLDLTQRASTDRDNNELINSRLSLTYRQELTLRSSFDTQFTVSDSDDRASDGTDTRRYDLDLTYRHAVTEDWDFTSGISMARVSETGIDDRSSNTIFFGLERRYVWN